MRIEAPIWLGLAVSVALAFVWIGWLRERHVRRAALAYSDLAFLERAIGRSFPWTACLRWLWALALVLAGLALARPSIEWTNRSVETSVVLCLDTSGSMATADVVPTRFVAVKAAARAFIDGLPAGTGIGIVDFASDAIPLGELVHDPQLARERLDRLPTPNGATAIGSALETAGQLLPRSGRRAIVLVTDGVNNRGPDPRVIASRLAREGVAMFTIGIGTRGSTALVPGTSEVADLDESLLREIARVGAGSYGRTADAMGLEKSLTHLAGIVISERHWMDISELCAVVAGTLAAGTALVGMIVGRFP